MKRFHFSFYVDRRGYLGGELWCANGQSFFMPCERFNSVPRLVRSLRYFRLIASLRAKVSAQ